MNGDHPADRLRAWVMEDFGLEIVSIRSTGLGADHAAELWRGCAANGVDYAVKLSGGGSPGGLVAPAHLAEHGVAGVPGPVRTRDGRLWAERDGRRLSVTPWVSDHRALAGGMTEAHWRSFGQLLAAVHATAVTEPLAALLPPADHTHDRATATVRYLDGRLGVSEPDGDDLVRAVGELWRAAAGQVSILVNRTDALGRELRSRPPAPAVICHADPHLGNLLLGPSGQVWLIDWDDAVLASPECDLMFALSGVPMFAPDTAREKAAFFDGYGPPAVDRTYLDYYTCARALFDIADWAAQVVAVDRYSESQRAEALSIVGGLLSPVGQVTLALG